MGKKVKDVISQSRNFNFLDTFTKKDKIKAVIKQNEWLMVENKYLQDRIETYDDRFISMFSQLADLKHQVENLEEQNRYLRNSLEEANSLNKKLERTRVQNIFMVD
ncbi:MAG: hypothetical protein EB150_10235 [Nitrososphaeria archaeon]|nr:hypothetical protein [Nitrososphaeria archaeon]